MDDFKRLSAIAGRTLSTVKGKDEARHVSFEDRLKSAGQKGLDVPVHTNLEPFCWRLSTRRSLRGDFDTAEVGNIHPRKVVPKLGDVDDEMAEQLL